MKIRLRYILLLAIALVAVLLLSKPGTPPAPAAKAPSVAAAPAAAPQPERKETPAPFKIACKYLSEMLAKCEPYTCEMPHPQEQGFVVRHTIGGLLPNGLCVHLQTAPKDMLVVCNYSQPMRLLVAEQLRTENVEKMSPEEENILSAGFDAECEVVDQRSGEVMKRTLGGEHMKTDTKAQKQEQK